MVISRIVLVFMLCQTLLLYSRPCVAEEVNLNENAKGFVEKLKNTLEDAFPEFGRNIGGIDFKINRDVTITQLAFDTDTGVVSFVANVHYYTSDESVINQAGLGISETIHFDTKYNVQANELTKFKVQVDLPKNWGSADVDLSIIKRVIDGDLAAVLELIPNGGVVKRNTSSEYDSQKKWYQDKYLPENVYFASSDFVRWATPETAGRWVVELIVSGGSAAPAIAAEARNEAGKELSHITAWLTKRAGNAAIQAALDLIAGKAIALPELKLVWQKVVYKSQVVIAGRSLPEIPIDHAAFVLIWKQGATAATTFNPVRTNMNDDNELRAKWTLNARYAIGPSGCRIVFVAPGGSAEKAGLAVGDIITAAGGSPVGSADSSTNLLGRQIKRSKAQVISLDVLSGPSTRVVNVTLDPVF